MFALHWTLEAQRAYEELRAKAAASLAGRQRKGKKKSTPAEGLFKQVHKTIQLLATNSRHPGLHTHAYQSLQHPFDPDGKVFEAYAQQHTSRAYRVFWCYGPAAKQLTILAITPHPD
jgi:hypothetical protein